MTAIWRACVRELGFLRRNPWEMALATWVPLLFVALLAAIFSRGVVRGLPVAVLDEDRSAISRELIRLVSAAPGLRIAAAPSTLEQARSLARSAEVRAVLHIPAGAGREVLAGRTATITAWFNASYQTAGNFAVRDLAAAVAAFGGRLALRETALIQGPSSLRSPPIRVRISPLGNGPGSYERNLLPLVVPGVLTTMLSLCVIASVGRELRDASLREWFESCGGSLPGILAGKALPYVLLFTLHGVLGLVWLCGIRGWPVAGSAAILVLAQFLLYAAYAALGLLVLSLVRRMSTALSLAGIYAGAGLAFCGGIFPVDGAPAFTRVWSALLPLSAYVKLQTQQLYLGAPAIFSATHLAVLAAAVAVPGVLAARIGGRTFLDPANWGLR